MLSWFENSLARRWLAEEIQDAGLQDLMRLACQDLQLPVDFQPRFFRVPTTEETVRVTRGFRGGGIYPYRTA